MAATSKTVYIVGAGFSSHAGLPLTVDFTAAILEGRNYGTGPSRLIADYLSHFISESFDHAKTAGAKYWPDLEDIFTCVDLSANSGHHLGGSFSPADLRTVRRAILSRIVRMLDRKYRDGKKQKGKRDRQAIEKFFGSIDPNNSGFISMNWDTVIEQKLGAIWRDYRIDYRCDAVRAKVPTPPNPDDFSAVGYKRELRKPLTVKLDLPAKPPSEPQPGIPLVKIHGSINWLYCDNCRRLFSFDPSEATRIADQLLTETDLVNMGKCFPKRKATVEQTIKQLIEKRRLVCFCNEKVPLGTRIATFSYTKALDFPMFQKSWFAAERLLREAKRWVFIGYSLPAADFEFKYLLKRMQLCRIDRPEIIVVSGGNKESLERTRQNYSRFFGRTIRDSNFIKDGLLTFRP
jgi:hypothetical protein